MNILLVDDHPLFLEGLKNLLATRGFHVCGTANNGQEAIEQVEALHPDVVLMDIQMPECNGLEATRAIKATNPAIQIVMLTVSEDDTFLFEAIKSGASGYLLKNLNAQDLFSLLEGLERGEAPISPRLASKVFEAFAHQQTQRGAGASRPGQTTEELTPRQCEVLSLVANGYTYRQVADKLLLSERTVKHHMGEIIKRLHLRNRAEAVAYARRAGVL